MEPLINKILGLDEGVEPSTPKYIIGLWPLTVRIPWRLYKKGKRPTNCFIHLLLNVVANKIFLYKVLVRPVMIQLHVGV